MPQNVASVKNSMYVCVWILSVTVSRPIEIWAVLNLNILFAKKFVLQTVILPTLIKLILIAYWTPSLLT